MGRHAGRKIQGNVECELRANAHGKLLGGKITCKRG